MTPDDPEALAGGLSKLWKDRSLTSRLADRAYEGVRAHYTVRQSADRLLDAYGAG